MSKENAMRNYWKAEDKLVENTVYDEIGVIQYQPEVLKRAVATTLSVAKKLCDVNEFPILSDVIRENMGANSRMGEGS